MNDVVMQSRKSEGGDNNAVAHSDQDQPIRMVTDPNQGTLSVTIIDTYNDTFTYCMTS